MGGIVGPGDRSCTACCIAETLPVRRCDLVRFEALLHIDIGGMDELRQRYVIDRLSGPELDVAHEPAGAFKQVARIGKLDATKESNVDVGLEGVGVGECRVTHTCRGMTVMQQFQNIVSTVTHDLKPAPRDFSQFIRMRLHPCLDGLIALGGTRKSQQLAHRAFTLAVLRTCSGAKLSWRGGCASKRRDNVPWSFNNSLLCFEFLGNMFH